MNTLLLVLIGLLANLVIGASVWAGIDSKDQRFYAWYQAAPPRLAWLLQPLTLMAWPIAVWLWWRERKTPNV